MIQFYQIDCKTHLHVGSGDSNYGVIDKLVQRDPSNQAPCIFASSLKGAFREYFKENKGSPLTQDIFGKDDKSKIIFHQAFLLSIPVRSNQFPFFNLIAPMSIQELISQLELLQKVKYQSLIDDLTSLTSLAQEGKVVVFNIPVANLKIEDFEGPEVINTIGYTIPHSISKIFGTRIALVDDFTFIELCSDYRLPIIARNNLENGQSKNLWYEQIIPRASRFFFATSSLPHEACEEFFNEFQEQKIVQIGANATIGYGVCSVLTL